VELGAVFDRSFVCRCVAADFDQNTRCHHAIVAAARDLKAKSPASNPFMTPVHKTVSAPIAFHALLSWEIGRDRGKFRTSPVAELSAQQLHGRKEESA